MYYFFFLDGVRYLGDFLKRREDKFLTSKERVKEMQDKIMKGREKASNQITAIKRATAKVPLFLRK